MPSLRGKPRPRAKASPKERLLPQAQRAGLRLVVNFTTRQVVRGASLDLGEGFPSVLDTSPTFTRRNTTREGGCGVALLCLSEGRLEGLLTKTRRATLRAVVHVHGQGEVVVNFN